MGLADIVKKMEKEPLLDGNQNDLINLSDTPQGVYVPPAYHVGVPAAQNVYASPMPQQQPQPIPPTENTSMFSNFMSTFPSLARKPQPIGRYRDIIYNKLKYIYDINNFSSFYTLDDVARLADTVSAVDLDSLTQRLHFPSVELTVELVSLALYDIVVLADDSGSMTFDKERVEDLEFIVSQVSKIATLFDADGINMRTFNNTLSVDGLTDETSVNKEIKKMQFSGGTPIGTAITRYVVNPLILNKARKGSLKKPVLVIIVTDGEPDSKNDVVSAIMTTKNDIAQTKYGAKAVSFQFAQVGRDRAAQQWLSEIDKDSHVGSMIDATSYFEHEQEEYAKKSLHLTPYLWLLKLLMGAIDPRYDEEDEVG